MEHSWFQNWQSMFKKKITWTLEKILQVKDGSAILLYIIIISQLTVVDLLHIFYFLLDYLHCAFKNNGKILLFRGNKFECLK